MASRRLSESSLDLSLLVFNTLLKEEVGGQFLVLIASEIRLSSSVLGEPEGHKAIDGVHLFLRDLNRVLVVTTLTTVSLSCTASVGSTTSSKDVWIASKNKIHEGAGILLNNSEKLRLRLLKLLHELVVEVRVLKDSLSDQTEVGVLSESSEGVGACWHRTTTY